MILSIGKARLPTALFTLCTVAAAGCTILGFNGDDRERLAQARALWASHGVADYSLVQRRLCYCIEGGASVRVNVEGGVVTDLTRVDSEDPITPEAAQYYYSVAGLFDFIAEILDREPDSIKIAYDAELGYPTSIDIDFIEMAIDDELGYEISEFTRRD